MPHRLIFPGHDVRWQKRHADGQRFTKRESAAYWAAEVAAMAKRQAAPVTDEQDGFSKVAGDLNLWPADDDPTPGQKLLGVVTSVNPAGPYGLQVKLMTPKGEVFTLASHKVLQGRLESIPGGLKVWKPGEDGTVLRVVFTGKEKSKKYGKMMLMYEVSHAKLLDERIKPLFLECDLINDGVPF